MILLATTQTKTRGKGKNPPVAEVRAENEKLKAELERIKNSAYCHMCDKHRSRIYFYENYDPRSKGKVSPICIDCARKIAMRTDDKGIEHSPTKESLIEALRYVDKPFFESLYNSSIEESKNEFSGQTPKTFYGCYISRHLCRENPSSGTFYIERRVIFWLFTEKTLNLTGKVALTSELCWPDSKKYLLFLWV